MEIKMQNKKQSVLYTFCQMQTIYIYVYLLQAMH